MLVEQEIITMVSRSLMAQPPGRVQRSALDKNNLYAFVQDVGNVIYLKGEARTAAEDTFFQNLPEALRERIRIWNLTGAEIKPQLLQKLNDLRTESQNHTIENSGRSLAEIRTQYRGEITRLADTSSYSDFLPVFEALEEQANRFLSPRATTKTVAALEPKLYALKATISSLKLPNAPLPDESTLFNLVRQAWGFFHPGNANDPAYSKVSGRAAAIAFMGRGGKRSNRTRAKPRRSRKTQRSRRYGY